MIHITGQRKFLKALKKVGFVYIATDSNNKLFAFTDKPNQMKYTWQAKAGSYKLNISGSVGEYDGHWSDSMLLITSAIKFSLKD